MNAIHMVVCLLITLHQQLRCEAVKQRPWLDGNEVDMSETIDRQKVRNEPRKLGRSANSFYQALQRARKRQIHNTGISSNQMNTETSLRRELTKLKRRPRWAKCYSCSSSTSYSSFPPYYTSNTDVSNYAASQVHYLQRTVGKMTATIRKMTVKMSNFEKWKSKSEDRMASLERLVQDLKLQTREPITSSTIKRVDGITRQDGNMLKVSKNLEKHTIEEETQTSSPTREEFRFLVQQTRTNAELISNITKHLKIRSVTIKRQIGPNGRERTHENDDTEHRTESTHSSWQNIRETGDLSTIKKAVNTMNETLIKQDRIVNTLYTRVGRLQRCCGMNKLLGKRIGIHEKRIKEVQSKANIALNSARLENRRVDTMNAKLENQRRSIRILQNEMQKFDTIATQSNQRMVDRLETNLRGMNDSINQLYKGGPPSKLADIEDHLAQNDDTISSFGILLSQQMDKIISCQTRIDGIEIIQEDRFDRLKSNITDVRRSMVEMDDKENQLVNELNDIRASIKAKEADFEESNKNLKLSMDRTLEQVVENIYDNITKIKITSLDHVGKIEKLSLGVGKIQTLNQRTDDKLQLIDGRINHHDSLFGTTVSECRREITEKINESKEDVTSNYNNILDIVAYTNATIEILRTKQNALTTRSNRGEHKFMEIDQKLSRLESLQTRLSSSLQILDDTLATKNSELITIIDENTEDMERFKSHIYSNITNRINELENEDTDHLDLFKNIEKRLSQSNKKLTSLNESLMTTKTIEMMEIKTKIGQLNGITHTLGGKMKLQHTEIEASKLSIASNKISLGELFNTTKRVSTTLQNSIRSQNNRQDSISDKMVRIQEGLTKKAEDIERQMQDRISETELRVAAMESMNMTLHNKVETCTQEMQAVKGGMRSLQETEDAVSAAINSYQNTLSKQDYVERNLTILSQKVRQTLQGQGIALKSIQQIMYKLNESLVESQQNIQQSYTEQLQNQDQDIRSMRGLMQNFSSLLTEVLNDQLSHDINQATLSTRQKSLAQKFDSQSTVIKELFSTSKRANMAMETVKSSLAVNTERLETTLLEIQDHKRQIRSVDLRIEDLFETCQNINSTHTKSNLGLKATIQQMKSGFSDLIEQVEEIEKEEELNQRTQSGKLNRINAKLQTLGNKVEANGNSIRQNSAMKMDIVSLMASQKLTTSLLQRTEQLENNAVITEFTLTTIQDEMERQILKMSKELSKDLNATAHNFSKMGHRISRLSEKLVDLQDRHETTHVNLQHASSILQDLTQWKNQANEAIGKVQEQDPIIQFLNETLLKNTKKLEEHNKKIQAHTDSIILIKKNSSNLTSFIQTIPDQIEQYGSSILATTQLLREIKGSLISVESSQKVDKILMDEMSMKISGIEKNITTIGDEIWYLTSDVDLNYNSTQQIFDQLYNYDEQLSTINTETTAFLSSLTSSVASLEFSLQEINGTFSYDLNDLKILVDDFQDAFDTSNRQLARHGDAVRIMKANTSNQFNHFSTSIDYLTQIVRESNEAVDENRDRLEALNETMLFLRLSIPALLATGVDEGLFQIRNTTNEGTLFSLNDLATRSLKGNIPRRGGEEDEFIAQASEGRDRKRSGLNLEAVLNGDADEMRVNSRVEAWMAGGSDGFGDDDNDDSYLNDFDFETLERRKRVANREDKRMLKLLRRMGPLQANFHGEERKNNNQKMPLQLTTSAGFVGKIAFSAGLTKTHYCCGVVKFNHEFANYGSTYNFITGKFTAPENAHYVFFVTVVNGNSYLNAAIVMNGTPQISLQIKNSANDSEESQSTNTVILPLSKGDEVWVEILSGSLLGYRYPAVTFSGLSLG